MARQRDMRNIRERPVWINGKTVIRYQVRLQVRDPITSKLRPYVGTFDHLDDARRWRDEKRAQGQLGDIGERDELSKAIQSVTLGDAITRFDVVPYINKLRQKRMTGWGSDEPGMLLQFKNREDKRLCRKLVVELTPTDFQDYLERRLAHGVKVTTVARELNPLRVMFRYAARHWQYPDKRHLFEGLFEAYRDELNAHRQRPITDGELIQIYKGINQRHGSRQRALWLALVAMAVGTGMRRGELLRLEWRDIDLKGQTVVVRQEIAKNRKPRLLPLSSNTHFQVECYRDQFSDGEKKPTDKVFGEMPTGMTPGAHEQAWRRICRDGGLDHHIVHFHDLRHTATTRFVTMKPALTVPELNWMLKGVSFTDRILNTYANPEILALVEDIRTKLNAAQDQSTSTIEDFAGVAQLEHPEDTPIPAQWADTFDWKTIGNEIVIDPNGPKTKEILRMLEEQKALPAKE